MWHFRGMYFRKATMSAMLLPLPQVLEVHAVKNFATLGHLACEDTRAFQLVVWSRGSREHTVTAGRCTCLYQVHPLQLHGVPNIC